MKKLLKLTALFLAGCCGMIRIDVSAAAAKQGTIGSLTWTLQDGRLTVSGEGPVPITQHLAYGEWVDFVPENYSKFYNAQWKDVAPEVTELVVESGVTQIRNSAFCLFPKLKSVKLPDTLTSIGAYAFRGCPQLEEVQCPDSVTEYGSYIFEGDTKLCNPEKPFYILNGNLVMYGGTDAEEITVPAEVKALGANVFQHHSELRSVTLPEGLQEIGSQAFSHCESLAQLEIPATVNTLGLYAFSYCTALKTITIPAAVTEIPDFAFSSCSALESITIPDTVTSIGRLAFMDCTALESIKIPDAVTSIGMSAFMDCNALKSITIPDAVTDIPIGMFSGCQQLEKVSGCKGVKSVGKEAFKDCAALTDIALPETIESIDPTALSGCDLLRSKNTKDGMFIYRNILLGAENLPRMFTIPEGVRIIANQVFAGSNPVEINCPASLRRICDGAFSNCGDLVCLNLNEGCEAIGTDVFAKSQYLKTLTIPQSVTSIGTQANLWLTQIYGESGSAAEQFAQENKIRFTAPPIALSGKDLTFDYVKDGWSFGNSAAVFGDSYKLSDADRKRLADAGVPLTAADGAWDGSCVGLSITAILAKNGVFAPYQWQDGAKTISELKPTDEVISFINYYQTTQGRVNSSTAHEPSAQMIYRMLRAAADIPHGSSPFLLVFAMNSGSHGTVGYAQESGSWTFDGKNYDGRILLWDSNAPDALADDRCLYYDSRKFDYCIPYYGVHVAEGASDNTAGIIAFSNDLAELNAYPYSYAKSRVTGDLNGDGKCSIADAVLLQKHLLTAENLPQGVFAAADLSGDKKVTAADFTLLKRLVLA